MGNGVVAIWEKQKSLVCMAAAILSVAGFCQSANAQSPGQASTDNAARQQAIRSLPLAELNDATREKLMRVVSKPTLYRRMPVETIDCDPDLFVFLVRYPEIVVNIWRLMEITNVSVQRTGPFSMKTFDGAGTRSSIELVYGTKDTHILYAEGFYEGPLFKRRITGRCVMLLKSGYGRGADGRSTISNQLDMFVQLDNVAAGVVAKTLHPMVGRTADLNFAESTNFLGQLSKAAENNGSQLQRLSARLVEVEPAVREQFSRVAATVTERAGGDPRQSRRDGNVIQSSGVAE